MAKRTLPLAAIRAECHRLVDQLVKGGGATRESLAHLEPGGRDNPDPTGLLRWYGLLNQAWAADQVKQEAHRSPTDKEAREQADEAALTMLARQPVMVQLAMPIGEMHVVSVHPKGLAALMMLRTHDEWLARLGTARNWVVEADAPHLQGRLEALDREIGVQIRILVAAVCHPGPRLPWDVLPTEPPEWTGDLNPIDILRIRNAHIDLNLLRFEALKQLAPVDTGKAPAQWATVVSSAAVTMGIAPSVLMQDWTVGELLTAFRLSGEANRQAEEKAKDKAKVRR